MTIAFIPKFLIFNLPAGIPLIILIGLLAAGYAEGRRGDAITEGLAGGRK